KLIFAIVGLAAAPFVGGLISGVDRRITARMQSRFGPPILQPFYDVFKLLGKTPSTMNAWLVLCSYLTLVSSALAVFLFFFRADLLLIFFVLTIGAVFQVMGALSVNSPYSQVGAQRELLQMLAYEPLIILAFIGIAMKTGSFSIESVYALDMPLLFSMPLLFLALGVALTIKLRKSPFDISASHHGHQEIVRGVLTEYTGPQLAMLEVAHWLDVVLILCLCSLFWATSWLGVIILLVVTYFLEMLVDNISSRMTWQWMLKRVLGPTVVLCVINILWLYAL
ncbi:NADH-quinone oxidoreductase subunit H, partial [Desulfovibrio sp. OttesenSCG-928-G15]|nr:NADH-quinone oxidoreductase subunit H [Desulfovibrio sp. OttesenSCG-928-G15]